MNRFNLLALSTASLLVLAGCNAVEPEPAPTTPIPPAPAEDVSAIGNSVDVPAGALTNIQSISPGVNEPALRATTLGTLNGCRIDRVVVDGKSFVLASAVRRGTTGSSSAYGYASCNLEPLR